MFKALTRQATFIAVISCTGLGLIGCGESAQEKATAQVCSSTKEIRAQLSKLSNLSLSTKAPEEIKDAATVMKKKLRRSRNPFLTFPPNARVKWNPRRRASRPS